MNVAYRRVGSVAWEDVILLGYYPGMRYPFVILRWNDTLQDFEEVVVPVSRIRYFGMWWGVR